MWRKICHVEKFQIYMHERCGKIWNFSTCGVISNFSTWQMWRNLKFLHSWHVYDVENVFKCVHIMLFCWKIGFVVIYAVCRKICFDEIYALLCGEKWNQRLRMWRKNYKYEVWLTTPQPNLQLDEKGRPWNKKLPFLVCFSTAGAQCLLSIWISFSQVE